MKKFLKNRNTKSIEDGSLAILNLAQYSMRLFDGVVKDITSNPEEIDYHEEPFINTQKGLTPEQISGQIEKFKRVKDYGEDFVPLSKDAPASHVQSYSKYFDVEHPSGMFKSISTAYMFSCRVMDTLKFCQKLRQHLAEKEGVNFIDATVTNFDNGGKKVTGVVYESKNGESVHDSRYDEYVVSGGIGSVALGKHLGIKVPLYGFKGHSLDLFIKPEEKFPSIEATPEVRF